MTDDLRAQARAMMQRDTETAGFGRSNPAPVVSIPQADPEPLSEQAAKLVVSMTFMSRKDNARPHVVSVDFSGMVHCICQASTPCWGIKEFCRATGRPVYQ